MPLIIVQASELSPEAKARIGQRIIDAFQAEDVRANRTLVLFREEDADFYTDGGPLVARPQASSRIDLPTPLLRTVEPLPPSTAMTEESAGRTRRTRAQLTSLKELLVRELKVKDSLSSFEAQKFLGLDDENAAGTLRRLFSDLEEDGLVVKYGQKRGTRYRWTGPGPEPGRVRLNGEVPTEDRPPVVLDPEEEARIQALMEAHRTPDEGDQ